MVGLTGLNVYIADFYNEAGVLVGSKRIQTSYRGVSKRTFKYQKGTYHVNPNASHSKFSTFPYLVDYHRFSYELNKPEPLFLKSDAAQVIDARAYNSILETDVLIKLNKTRSNLFGDLFNLKNIIIMFIVAYGIYYFASGGSLVGSEAVAAETVNTIARAP